MQGGHKESGCRRADGNSPLSDFLKGEMEAHLAQPQGAEEEEWEEEEEEPWWEVGEG